MELTRGCSARPESCECLDGLLLPVPHPEAQVQYLKKRNGSSIAVLFLARANDWKLGLNCRATYDLWCCINHTIVTGLLLCPSCFATLIYLLEINKAREVREKSFSCRPKDSTEV